LQELTMQEWTMTEGNAGVDIAGVDNDGVIDYLWQKYANHVAERNIQIKGY